MKTDPFGNQPGTVRGILALFFAFALGVIVVAFVYRTEILGLQFITPDAYTISFFVLGSTIIGSYFGLRSGQQSVASATQTTTTTTDVPLVPVAKTQYEQPTMVSGGMITTPVSIPVSTAFIGTSSITTAEDHLAVS